MIIVSDTSAITALLQINKAEVLLQMYHGVIIPKAVEAELGRAHVLPVLRQVLKQLEQVAGFRISTELKSRVLAVVGGN